MREERRFNERKGMMKREGRREEEKEGMIEKKER